MNWWTRWKACGNCTNWYKRHLMGQTWAIRHSLVLTQGRTSTQSEKTTTKSHSHHSIDHSIDLVAGTGTRRDQGGMVWWKVKVSLRCRIFRKCGREWCVPVDATQKSRIIATLVRPYQRIHAEFWSSHVSQDQVLWSLPEKVLLGLCGHSVLLKYDLIQFRPVVVLHCFGFLQGWCRGGDRNGVCGWEGGIPSIEFKIPKISTLKNTDPIFLFSKRY